MHIRKSELRFQADRQSLLAAKAASGHAFVQDMLEKTHGLLVCPWAAGEKGAGALRPMVASYTHLKSWKWVLVGGTYVDEFTAEIKTLRDRVALAALGAVVVISVIWLLLIRRMVVRPLGEVSAAAERMSQGDLTTVLVSERGDEVGRLFAAMGHSNRCSQG